MDDNKVDFMASTLWIRSISPACAHDHIRQHYGIPYHIRQHFPFCTWIVARGDSHQTNQEAAFTGLQHPSVSIMSQG